ncbi:MAG: type II toxin-antitoxin system VapC family toxin [bacterium]|nr:type II toxin-antitoxin system VapC family toxin [bacterium]
MENLIIVDTDVIINYVKQTKPSILEHYIRLQNKKQVKLCVSSITVFEYFSGISFSHQAEYQSSEILFKQFTIQDVTEPIVKIAAKFNNEMKLFSSIGLADILISATALFQNAKLLTLNKRHFHLIPGLKFASI